jgi:hypothetical protein
MSSSTVDVNQFFSSNFSAEEYRIRLYGLMLSMPEEKVNFQITQSTLIVIVLLWYLYHFYRSDQEHPDIITKAANFLRQLINDYSAARRKKNAQSLKKQQRHPKRQ